MFKPIVHIVFTPGRIEAALCSGGRVLRTIRVELDRQLSADSWGEELSTLDDALGQAVRGVGAARGAMAILSYVAPSTTIEVIGVRACGEEARQAAALSLAEMLGEDVDRLPTSICGLVTGKQESFLLACAERDETSEALRAWLIRSGLTPVAMRPMAAVGIREACLLEQRTPQPHDCVINIGARTMTMILRVGSDVRLVRHVELGAEHLRDVYLSVLTQMGEGERTPPYERAMIALLKHGVPAPQDVVDELTGVRGHAVLPILQPVLQRISIEIKQTLRFGIADFDARKAVVILAGQGGSIPGLGRYLGDHLDLSIEAQDEAIDPISVGGAGSEMEQTIRCRANELNLMPRSAVEARQGRSMRRTLAAGTLAAMVLLGAEISSKVAAISGVSDSMARLEPEVSEAKKKVALRDQARIMADRLHDAESALSAATSDRADWVGALALLDAASSASVRLTDVSGEYESRRPVLSVKGIALIGADGADPLRGYMATLAGSPVVENVTMGSTRATEIEGRAARSFSMKLQLRSGSDLASVVEGE